LLDARSQGRCRQIGGTNEENHLRRYWRAVVISAQFAGKRGDLRRAGAALRQDCEGKSPAAIRTKMSRSSADRRVPENLRLDRHQRSTIPGQRGLQAAVISGELGSLRNWKRKRRRTSRRRWRAARRASHGSANQNIENNPMQRKTAIDASTQPLPNKLLILLTNHPPTNAGGCNSGTGAQKRRKTVPATGNSAAGSAFRYQGRSSGRRWSPGPPKRRPRA
jgi:hypothetical protein